MDVASRRPGFMPSKAKLYAWRLLGIHCTTAIIVERRRTDAGNSPMSARFPLTFAHLLSEGLTMGGKRNRVCPNSSMTPSDERH